MIVSLALLALLSAPTQAESAPTVPARVGVAAGAATGAALGAPRQGNPGQGGAQSGDTPPPIQDAGDYFILNLDETGDGIDLAWFTRLCQDATGLNFTYDEQTANALQNAKVRLFGTKRIPKDEFYSFYQIVMFINQFILTKVGPDHLSVILVQPVTPQAGAARTNLRNEAIYLLPDELDDYADQVATQVITVLHLPNTDVRTLGNSLRGLTADASGGQGVIPVGNTQSVILTGFASNVASLARILKLVDTESARDTGIQPMFEVIPLEFAAAEDLADILEQLLEASKRQIQQNRNQAAAQGPTGQIQASGGETKILTDQRTNSLLVMALPDDMDNIRQLVARLDVDVVEPERTYHVYALENAQAEDLSEVLEDFIEGAQRVSQAGARPGAGAAGAVTPGGTSRDNEIVVVPEPVTNSLLIAASKRRYEEVLELIHRLDERQDQVLIETALIELTDRESLDLGVELGGADVPGVSETGGFGVTSFGLSTFIDSDNDGIFDARAPNAGLGVTAGILDGDDFALPILVAALKDRNDTNVLNIPSVLVNNNGSATVTSIDSQPTTQITAVGGVAGQTQENFNDYQDAGITMQISPSISASGYLRLDVSLEVSTFNGSFSGAIPPPKTTRTIQTSVNVPDGDTMVIGGIITDNMNLARTSVPLLGDLPLLGALFRRDTDNANSTTLYFFVTPHILQDKNFADLAEVSYKVKLHAADKIGVDRVRMIDEDFEQGEEGVDLRGFEVPLYRSPGAGEVDPSAVGLDPARRAELMEAGETPRR